MRYTQPARRSTGTMQLETSAKAVPPIRPRRAVSPRRAIAACTLPAPAFESIGLSSF